MKPLDRRLYAARPDLADIRLKGAVDAERFVAGAPARIIAPIVDLRAAPRLDAGVDTQLLFGADVRVFERRDGWAWVQAEADNYVGYCSEGALDAPGPPATHVVCRPRSFVYPHAELKAPHIAAHSMGAAVRVDREVEKRGTPYAILSDGTAMIAGHLRPSGAHDPDYVTVAELFVHTPYLWGGSSGFGIDCSGLVQLALFMTGRSAPRDSDMQAQALGHPIDPEKTPLRRGDLVFWEGHVAILIDDRTALHANGSTMSVALEPLERAIKRIAPLFGRPTRYRRIVDG